ncbi:2-hydroxyacid dehydrogenase [Desemzia sp. FAM 23989]|uniref:2-hydroxyacid dehydrogenase n=1 Tax=Desemzia sp. FAM 23989 TaxID=3259523 RepID=UPI0038879ACC
MKIKLLEPLRVPDEMIEDLSRPLKDLGHDFEYYNEKTTNTTELVKRSRDADIVMIANNPYPAEVIEAAEQLQLINVAFTGVDHVDKDAAKAKEIKIANAAGYSNQAVAELVIGLTLDLYRGITQGNADIRKNDFPGPFQGNEIKGKTVGIIGTGKIGTMTAKLFKAFGAQLIGYNRSEHKEAKELGLEYVELETLMQQSDIISVHLPLNDETKGIVSKEMLSKMKSSAILVNCARGPIIDNKALAELLNAGEIAGAGIDVFDMEPPLPADYPLLEAENTVLAPHVGYLTDEAMISRAYIAFENTLAFVKGEPQNIVQE